jgi:EKC/KEOPS complex subunit CGI121/TPRKB
LPYIPTVQGLTNPTPQISEAYRRYGISPSTKDLFVVKVSGPNGPSHDDIAKHLSEHVEGDQLPVTDENIAPATDNSKVAKYYKLNGLNWLDAIKDQSQKRKEVETLVVGTLAVRGI